LCPKYISETKFVVLSKGASLLELMHQNEITENTMNCAFV